MSGNRLDAVRRRLRTVTSGRRGSAQLGLVLAAAAATAGMTLGSGVASQHAKSGYDLAWLPDGTRGQLVQVDPVLGRANVRLQVAAPGSTLSIQQGNGQLVVIDRKTGKITSIDLGTLLVGGTRAARPGDGVKVLLAGPRLYVADLPRGTVQAVDPATQANIGVPWSAGRALTDIGVDGAHDVWALDSRRTLSNLRWNGTTLAPVSTRNVAGAGPGSVIVGHTRGITLVGNQGAIVRVGTDHDRRLDAPNVRGPLHGPDSSPDGLVPVSDPGTSSVVIVSNHDAVVDDVSGYGCNRPGTPTAFDGKVYVPCIGAHKVIVLDPSGHQVGSAIPTPGGGDPQLTVTGGHLVIDVPGSGRATVIDRSGTAKNFPTVAPDIGVQNPNTPPPDPPVPPKPNPSKKPHGNTNDNGHHGNNPDGGRGDGPPRSGDPSGAPTGGPAPHADDNATATARPDGSVLVSWDASAGSGSTVITDANSGEQVATVPPGADSATVTVLAPGTTTSFVVRNAKLHATTNSVTTSARPGTVSDVRAVTQGFGNNTAKLKVTWSPAAANGSTVSYAVGAGGPTIKSTDAVSVLIEVPCVAASGRQNCSGTITVTPRNSAGAGVAGSVFFKADSGTPTQQPSDQPPATNPSTNNPAPDPNPPANPDPQPPAQIAMPSAGAVLLTSTQTAGNDSSGQLGVAHVTINAPSDWSAFGAAGGSCALYADGVNSGAVPCGATNETHDFGYEYTGSHEYWVVASDAATGRTVESAHQTQPVTYRQVCLNSAGQRSLTTTGQGVAQRPICDADPNPTCPNCQIPFKQIPAAQPSLATLIGEGIGRQR